MNPRISLSTHLRHALVILVTSPLLLLAAICDPDEIGPTTIYYDDIANVLVSQGPTFTTNDTIWVLGRFTSMAYDDVLRDSIPFPEERVNDIFRIARLETASTLTGGLGKNAEEAVDEFEFVTRTGEVDFLGSCPSANVVAIAPLSVDGQNYIYEIGLKPKNTGDFVLNWERLVRLQNGSVNLEVLQKYPWQGDANYLGLTACGITNSRADVEGENRDFFFTVE